MMKMPIVDLLARGRELAARGERVSVLWQEPESLAFVARGREYRSEFHINPSDEVMLAVKGEMRLHYRTPEGKEEVAVVPEGSTIYTPAGTPHSPRFRARLLSPGDRAPAPRRRGRPLPVVLPALRRAAPRGGGRSAGLSQRSRLQGLCPLLRQRGFPHLQDMRPRDAAAQHVGAGRHSGAGCKPEPGIHLPYGHLRPAWIPGSRLHH